MLGNSTARLFVGHYFFFFFKIFSLEIILTLLSQYAGHVEGNLWAEPSLEEMMFNAHEQELTPMELPPINYEEFLHEPYIPERVLKPRFLVESASSGPS